MQFADQGRLFLLIIVLTVRNIVIAAAHDGAVQFVFMIERLKLIARKHNAVFALFCKRDTALLPYNTYDGHLRLRIGLFFILLLYACGQQQRIFGNGGKDKYVTLLLPEKPGRISDDTEHFVTDAYGDDTEGDQTRIQRAPVIQDLSPKRKIAHFFQSLKGETADHHVNSV